MPSRRVRRLRVALPPLFAACACLGGLGCGVRATATFSKVSTTSSPASAKATAHQVSAGTPLKLAFITNNSGDFWSIAVAGLEKYQAETGVKVDAKIPNPPTVAEQKKIMEDLVTQGYHGFAISAIAPDDLVNEIDRAASSLNVITHDSDSPSSARLAYIGTNNFEAGKALGKRVRQLAGENGSIAVFVGSFAAANAAERLRGIETALEGSKIKIIAEKEDNADRAKAQSNVADVLADNAKVDVLVGLYSYNGPAIYQAVKESKRDPKPKVAAFDEEALTLDGIAEGVIDCTVVQKPFEFGYQSAKLLHELCTKGESALPAGGVLDPGVDLIDAKNVKEFRARLAELLKR